MPDFTSPEEREQRCWALAGFSHMVVVDKCKHNIIEELSVAEIVVIVVIISMLLCCMSTIVYYNYKASVLAHVSGLQDQQSPVLSPSLLSIVPFPTWHPVRK